MRFAKTRACSSARRPRTCGASACRWSGFAALAHVYGAEICVDAAQSGGVVPIHAAEDGIDYLCCAGHKGLYGPMGTGMLITRQGEKLKSLIQGGTGTLAMQLEQPRDMPEYLESGTQNVPGILALGAGLDFVRARGEENVRQAEMRHVRRIWRGVQQNAACKAVHAGARRAVFRAGARLQCARHGERDGGRPACEARHRCALRHALRAVRTQKMGTDDAVYGGAVRVSPVFTDDRQAAALIRAVAELRASDTAHQNERNVNKGRAAGIDGKIPLAPFSCAALYDKLYIDYAQSTALCGRVKRGEGRGRFSRRSYVLVGRAWSESPKASSSKMR